MNEQLIKFIELCLMDGVVTDKEREVIFRKSKELGVEEDECEIILEGMITQNKKADSKSDKKKVNTLIKKERIIRKAPILDSYIFDKNKTLRLILICQSLMINKKNEYIKKLSIKNAELKKDYKNSLDNLNENLLKNLNNLQINDKIVFGTFHFVVNEIILNKNIKDYFNERGSLQFGKRNSVYSPKYPHPVAVLYNYVELGVETNDLGVRLRGYISGDEFIYFRGEPTHILDLNKSQPDKILIYNKENLKIAILVFKDHFEIFEFEFDFYLMKIEYEKKWLARNYEHNFDQNYFTKFKIKHNRINLFQDL